jgi:hypothetical protein
MITNEEPSKFRPLVAGIVLTLCVLGTVLLSILLRYH